ncbi:glycosyltransferase family 2 protein [Paenibacillus donghaensis]|uniref:Glycosyl transferase family 2 n=1 Tax=Paenibacillus donghaensis TaxID=414771 RepID=A0A2Z2KS94_9BACL|nr:glycosyltransferase [Paenibacillus donghaensis]ASA24432.1 glycosyl transferase family 2 [Paenibacillus donghaensis]
MAIKKIWGKIKSFTAGVLSLSTDIELKIISDLTLLKGEFISTGTDPAFLLEGKIFNGWNKISWYSESEEYIPLKLYWDNGLGFSENNSIIFSSIPKGTVNYNMTFYIPEDAVNLRLDPGDKKNKFVLKNMKFKKTTKFKILLNGLANFFKQRGANYNTFKVVVNKSLVVLKSQGIKGLWYKAKQVSGISNGNVVDDYSLWLEKNTLSKDEQNIISLKAAAFVYKPLISVILPVYNVEEEWLRKCIESVRNQLYTNWELCISDDASTKGHIQRVLNEYMDIDKRIKVVFRKKNGHISETSNSSLEVAEGEYIALLDHDDELTLDALYEVVKLINEYPEADMIYSDEDKIGMDGIRHSPFFKPDWSPDLLLTHMYTCHLGVYRRSLVEHVGSFRKGVEGSQDFDLALRITEQTSHIYHIPKILYHWRTIPESTASGSGAKNYTHFAGLTAVQDAMKRRNINGWVEELDGYSNFYRVHYNVESNPMVSIIIPTKDNHKLLSSCLSSLTEITKYSNYEIIVVDNGSEEQDTFDLFDEWKDELNDRFKLITINSSFNFSALNNAAVKHAVGELILFLNNDIQVIEENWLSDMVGSAMREKVGAVGAYLKYPDNTVQHSGLTLGLGAQRAAGDGHHYRPIDDPGYFGALISVKNVSAVTAACLMVERKIFEEVGGFDENLTVAYNDVDLCLLFRDKGYLNVWLPYVKLIHHESKSRGYDNTSTKVDRLNKEAEYLKNKWGAILNSDVYYNPNLSLDTGYITKI